MFVKFFRESPSGFDQEFSHFLIHDSEIDPSPSGGLQSEKGTNPSASVLDNRIFFHYVGQDGALKVKKSLPGGEWMVTESRPLLAEPHILTSISSPPSLFMVLRGLGNIGPNQIEFWRSLDGVPYLSMSLETET